MNKWFQRWGKRRQERDQVRGRVIAAMLVTQIKRDCVPVSGNLWVDRDILKATIRDLPVLTNDDLAMFEQIFKDYAWTPDGLRDACKASVDEIRRLRWALGLYGCHDEGCAAGDNSEQRRDKRFTHNECTCGFREVLKTLSDYPRDEDYGESLMATISRRAAGIERQTGE
jgi:hypothetical protein